MPDDNLILERPDGRDVKSSIREATAAAMAAVASGQIPRQMTDPAIADAGTAVIPRAGAGSHEGERTAAPAPAETVSVVDETPEEEEARLAAEEAAERGEAPPEGEAVAEEEAPPAEGVEGEEPVVEGEWPVVELPPVREGREPLAVEVEDPALAEHLTALARGSLRRDQLQRAMADLEQSREELAQFQDAMRLDPVNFVVDQVPGQTKLQIALSLLADPEIYEQVAATYGELDEAGRREKMLEIENDRLKRLGSTSQEIGRLSQIREQGRQIRAAIQRIIPEDMDERRANLLSQDLMRDVTQHITQNRIGSLRVEDLPPILEGRLELYGVSPAEAFERMQDTGTTPLPLAARAARGTQPAPARPASSQPARTGKALVAQANARRRVGAVPGGGAGVPATGPAFPRKQTVKERIASMRDALLGRSG